MTETLVRAEQDPALVAAWRRFVDYDTNATYRRRVDRRLRLSVIALACAVALLVALLLQADMDFATSNEARTLLIEGLRLIAFIGALLLLLLATYSFLRSQTNANAEYYAYRLAQTLVLREIYRSRALARESYAASAAVDEAPYGFSRRLSVSAGCISSECKFSGNFRVEFKR